MSALQLAEATLLQPADIDTDQLQRLLHDLSQPSIDYGDLYFQNSYHETWSLEDSRIKQGHLEIAQGVGVRAISGEKTGFAYSDQITIPTLKQAIQSTQAVTRGIPRQPRAIYTTPPTSTQTPRYGGANPLQAFTAEKKVELLALADHEARTCDPRVSQVFANLTGSYETVLISATDGTHYADIRPLVRLDISVIVEHKGQREQGYMGGGGRFEYDYFNAETIQYYAREAVRQALVNLEAQAAPAGTMPVVLASGWPGILLHEAVGHGLEGDFNRKGTSAYTGRIGEKVSSSLCTVVDDGTLSNRRGSLNIDDEGTPTQCTTLIENGQLKGYMQDKHNAYLMGTTPTGNGRRESYAHLPMPRMTNTYMQPGAHTQEEIIASVEKGLYAVNFGGGQVDITSGKFVFSASEAYLIENGKITQPVKGATLIGNGPEVMHKISMVGDDLKLDTGVGTCGKEGQNIPVGVGQPTLKIDNITVGGTATD